MDTTLSAKCASGIDGLDSVTNGGLPKGRTTLLYGGAGCGKTLLGLQFLLRGAERYGEPGVYLSFEENQEEVIQNAKSIGCELQPLVEKRLLYIDAVDLQWPGEEVVGEFTLDGLFIRISVGIKAVGARRIVIDSIEALFTRYTRQDIVRTELYRLHRWLKDQGITAIVTGEAGGTTLTRFGIEEYISDAVIQLDHRVVNQIATRRLRVVKLRGSAHGTNEYPFTITDRGLAVLPVTSLTLDYPVSEERVSSGVARLDTMLDGAGYYRGSSVLLSGTSGTGKTSLAMAFAQASCLRGDRVLFFAFEEPPAQIIRNLRSIGMDLQPLVAADRLRIQAQRATSYGLETHLAQMLDAVQEFQPDAVIVDPVSNLASIAPERDVKGALTRLIDHLKQNLVTVVFSDLSGHGSALESTSTELSSLMDTWILLRDIELNGERNRGIYILKSRGMGHSNQIREFVISKRGLDLLDVYAGEGGVLTGTARVALEAREAAQHNARQRELEQLRGTLAERQVRFERQTEDLEREFEHDLRLIQQRIEDLEGAGDRAGTVSRRIASMRGQDRS